MNTGIPDILRQYDLSNEVAIQGISLYFVSLMVARFLGALILKRISSSLFLIISSIVALIGLGMIIAGNSTLFVCAGIVVVAAGSANIFPLIFSLSVEKFPEKSSEISALMIMAISGGAVFPFLMGVITESLTVKAGIVFLFLISLYLGVIGFWNLSKSKSS